jgi:hypothetical protein
MRLERSGHQELTGLFVRSVLRNSAQVIKRLFLFKLFVHFYLTE